MELQKLKKLKKEKDKKLEELERNYLSKIAKLLILTQIHCEIKTDIYDTYKKSPVSVHAVEVEP